MSENDIEISDLQFQISGSSSRDLKGEFTTFIYGATKEGYSVCLTVTEKRPDFFIQLPEAWTSSDIRQYKQFLNKGIEAGEVVLTIEHHKSFWDFTNNKMFRFLRVQTRKKRIYIQIRELCLDKDTMKAIPYKGQFLQVYEANIDPMLRFFHEREITPAGWITVGQEFWIQSDEPLTTCIINAKAVASDVNFAAPDIQMTTAPFKTLSWDIECTSSHGDFPLATKTWRKPALEIIERCIKNEDISAAIIAAVQPSYETNGSNINRIYIKNHAVITAILEDEIKRPPSWPSTVDALEQKLNEMFPAPDGDPIIQIGAVLEIEGKIVRKDIFVLGTCDDLPEGAGTAYPCRTEAGVIRGFCALVAELDPDILVGFNTDNFDNKYLWDRATVCHCTEALSSLKRYLAVELKAKSLGSSALGDNRFHIFTGEGRLHIDLLAYVKRNATLESYKLDNVTATYMSGSVKSLGINGNKGILTTKSTKGTSAGRYIVLMDEENDLIGEKLRILSVGPKELHLEMSSEAREALAEHSLPPVRWAQAKDDVSPKEIFALHKGTPADRTRIASYCLQDCVLVLELMQKLEVLNNAIAMANICWVPMEFIFSRGQGIKAESLMFYECRKAGQLIPVLPQKKEKERAEEPSDIAVSEVMFSADDEDGYEGAIVLDPLSGIYGSKDPVAALDFSSLYPSTMISEGYSHDTHVNTKDYDLKGNFICLREGSDEFDNLPNCTYSDTPYNILQKDPTDTHKDKKLIVVGKRVCRFVQTVDGKPVMGTLPAILEKLLAQRKSTRKLIPGEPDEFRKGLLEARQLAYKLTSNSLYGQMGSATFKVRRKIIAASTTAHGRSQILFSKAAIEATYGPTAGDTRCSAICVYGDTDSIFISFRPTDPATGERLDGREAQEAAKALAEEAGHKISGALKRPHDFEFDKMFRCFCLLSKKRYVGDMTEGDRDPSTGDFIYDRKSMGIAMKRRGNAPIVKYIYGGVIERILVERSIPGAFKFAQEATRQMVAGRFPLRRFTITKALKSEYKAVPAHKVLADRIGSRDPGNRPASNDRLPYVFVMRPDGRPWHKDTSQGERIETPSFMQEKGLKLDYASYINNQIAKPVAEMFALVLEQLPGFKSQMLWHAKGATDHDKRINVASDMLFKEILVASSGQKDIRSFFG